MIVNEAAIMYVARLVTIDDINKMIKVSVNWPMGPFEFAILLEWIKWWRFWALSHNSLDLDINLASCSGRCPMPVGWERRQVEGLIPMART